MAKDEIAEIPDNQFFNAEGVQVEGEQLITLVAKLQADDLLYEANCYAIRELTASDRQMQLHLDGDDRAISTLAKWKTYRKALRDYVKNDKIAASKPTRPS